MDIKKSLEEKYTLRMIESSDPYLGEESIEEKIDLSKATMGDVIKDFQKSDAPQFKGKSKEKRKEMAIAAKLEADRSVAEEKIESESQNEAAKRFWDYPGPGEHSSPERKKKLTQRVATLPDSSGKAIDRAQKAARNLAIELAKQEREKRRKIGEEIDQIDEIAYSVKDEKRPVTVSGVKGMKSRPFKKKFRSHDHFAKWHESEKSDDHEVHHVYQEEVERVNEVIDHSAYQATYEPLHEAVKVVRQKYSWGNMMTVHHLDSPAYNSPTAVSYPLHPEHQEKVKNLKDGESTKFKIETGHTVHATRNGHKITLHSPSRSNLHTEVDHHHFFDRGVNESQEHEKIKKEYSDLKKRDLKTLRGHIQQTSKVVDVSGFKSKDHAISHILRSKHGDKRVDAALKEEIESLDEVSKETLGGYVKKASDQFYGAKKFRELGAKAKKRSKGINLANKKLDMKEDSNEPSIADKILEARKKAYKNQNGKTATGSKANKIEMDPVIDVMKGRKI